jgi:hypothetical protein
MYGNSWHSVGSEIFHFFFQFVLAAGHGKAMMPNVPLYDEFGDWATPKSLQRDIFLRL